MESDCCNNALQGPWRGHTDGGDGIRGIDRLGERQLLRHRVVVLGQHAVGADDLHVGDACPAQQGRRGLGARELAPAPDLRIFFEGALHLRARPLALRRGVANEELRRRSPYVVFQQ